MDENISFKFIIPLVLLTLILVGGLYYWQANKNAKSSGSATSGGIILGDTSGGNDASGAVITNGEVYNAKISEIRQPINQGFEDLAAKAKYTTLFNSEEIQKIINDTRQKIEDGIKTLEHLNLDSKFKEANAKHLQSLNLLLEAIDSFEKARSQTDKKEAQRLSELYSYDIEQSNKILKEIQIPR